MRGLPPIEWENLTKVERLALAAAGEQNPLAFTALWYNITQGDQFRPNWHHHYYNWAAEKVLAGEVQNVIINIPPGGTKTEFWSVHLPVYSMVKFPRVRILNTSYSKDLVDENSTRSRALVKAAEFQEFYPFKIGKDKVDDWTIDVKGKRAHQLFSRSSGGQITGVRGGYMASTFSGYVMADDWSKPDSMFSETKRNKSNALLSNTLRSRRANSRTPFILVQQRVHGEDATGFILGGGMGLKADLHITIPALIDEDYIKSLPDELQEVCRRDVCDSEQVGGYWSYWPEKDDINDLLALKESSPYVFASQYMQAPQDLDGDIFLESDFLYYGDTDDGADLPTPPFFEYRFITTDTAQKKGDHNDYTVFAEWGMYQGKIYRLSFRRARLSAKELRRDFESFCKAAWAKNGPVNGNLRKIFVEDKSSGTGLIQEMEGRLPLKVTGVPRGKDNSKIERALDCQPFHAMQCIVLPYGDEWNVAFVSEVANFKADDSHKHDDMTDVMMDAIEQAIIRPATKKKRRVRKPGYMATRN